MNAIEFLKKRVHELDANTIGDYDKEDLIRVLNNVDKEINKIGGGGRNKKMILNGGIFNLSETDKHIFKLICDTVIHSTDIIGDGVKAYDLCTGNRRDRSFMYNGGIKGSKKYESKPKPKPKRKPKPKTVNKGKAVSPKRANKSQN